MEKINIPPVSEEAFKIANQLANEILKNIELSELPLSSIMFKCARLARLLNDFEYRSIFEYEVSGYPTSPNGVTQKIWNLAKKAGRVYEEKDSTTKEIKSYASIDSIEALESRIEALKITMQVSRDPDINVSSANPHQQIMPKYGNALERQRVTKEISDTQKKISSRKTMAYSYVLDKHITLEFSEKASDTFQKIRSQTDLLVSNYMKGSSEKLVAIRSNLLSKNKEDLSNAVHSCRRLLEDLADTVFPATESRTKIINGKKKEILLGKDNYINRIITYVDDNSSSEIFRSITGSNLSFIGDKIDSIASASQKGTHKTIQTIEEAERCFIYTYLLISDVLRLKEDIEQKKKDILNINLIEKLGSSDEDNDFVRNEMSSETNLASKYI